MLLISLREKQGKDPFQETLRVKGRVVGYERMTYRWMLLGGNMLMSAFIGFGNKFLVVIFVELCICWDQMR